MKYLAVTALCLAGCKHDAGPELFGTKVTPPGVLATVRPDISEAELKKLVPDAVDDKGHGFLLGKPARNAKLYATTFHGAVVHTYVAWSSADLPAVLTKAWGPPDTEHDRMDDRDLTWRSTETGWRASVHCGPDPKDPWCDLTFHPHKPLEAMFVRPIRPPGELASVHPHASLAELKKLTPIHSDNLDQMRSRELDLDGADETIYVIKGALGRVQYTVPLLAAPMIEKAWGPGSPGDAPNERRYFDATSGWDVVVSTEKDKLWLDYGAFDTFEHELDELVALSSAKTADEAKAAHPELGWVDGDPRHINLPANEYTAGIELYVHVQSVGVFAARDGLALVMLGEKKYLDAVKASFTKRWGAPLDDKHSKDAVHLVWPHHASIEYGTEPDETSFGIHISPDSEKY
ncbi:MAG TPA: hypothetical protein VGC41_23860 [Kofleriaceae bacterium]